MTFFPTLVCDWTKTVYDMPLLATRLAGYTYVIFHLLLLYFIHFLCYRRTRLLGQENSLPLSSPSTARTAYSSCRTAAVLLTRISVAISAMRLDAHWHASSKFSRTMDQTGHGFAWRTAAANGTARGSHCTRLPSATGRYSAVGNGI